MNCRVAAALVIASFSGCLEENPQFDGGTTDGTTEAVGTTASGTTDPEADSSTGAPAECIDLFEPNDGEHVAEVTLGVLDAAVADAQDLDIYKLFSTSDEPTEVRAVIDDPTLTLCIYPGCDGDGNTIMPMGCRTGNSISDEFGQLGCCGEGAAQLAYTCALSYQVVTRVEISGSVTECTPYVLETMTVVP